MLDYYYGIIMIGLALFIFERAILACVFKHIAELKGYYGIKEWLLNVIKLRDDEPSGYYCLDGIFI